MATHGRGDALKVLAWAPVGVYAVAVGLGLVGLFTGVLSVRANIGVLILAALCFALSLAAAYFTVRRESRPTSSAFIGQLFAVGFWRGSRVFPISFLLLGTVAVLTFAAGAVVLPRGTTVEKVGESYYRASSGQRVELTPAEATYLQDAQSIFVPIGGAMVLSIFSAGLLRGVAIVRRQSVSGLTRVLSQSDAS
ncbi:hypothetical protein AB4Z18_10725 [Leifsonia sp. 2TAF2]|uniref:hypothetical protein n=1 Tax=Leifsonia sp. 2TAF2 TaxID=3233009 RepID=UPI003F9CD461